MKLLQAEAGVNDGKAGLQSAAGLFSKAGIFDKRSEAFNIKELDPFLLFDTRDSMLNDSLETASFLEPVPVLRNLARGSNKGGDAEQDVALNQPKALPLIDGEGYYYGSGVANNHAYAPSLGYGPSDNHSYYARCYISSSSGNLYILSTRADSIGGLSAFINTSNGSLQTLNITVGATLVYSISASMVPADKEFDYLIAYDGSNNSVSVYIDGVTLINNAIISVAGWDSTTPFFIGARGASTTDCSQSRLVALGYIKQAKAFSSVVTPSSVSTETPVLDVDFTSPNVRHGATKFKCATGQVVTINQSGQNPATVVKKAVLRFDGVDDFMDGVFGQSLSSGYLFASFSVLGDGGSSWVRLFSTNPTGGTDASGSMLVRRYSSEDAFRVRYDAAGSIIHDGMYDSARGDMLLDVSITNGSQTSFINNADEENKTLSGTVSVDDFVLASRKEGDFNMPIDLEYLALFPASITDEQADAVRNYINNRNNVFDLKDGFGYYFFDPQSLADGAVTSWNGRIIGSDNGDVDKLATQATAADQPTSDGYKVTFADATDHLDIPSTTQAGWQVVGTSLGTFAYKVDSDAVTELNLLGNLGSASYRQAGDLYGIILLPENATTRDINDAKRLLIDRGASDGVTPTSLLNFWRSRDDIVEFGEVDVSSVTNFSSAWRVCSSLTSFPEIDASSGRGFSSAWYNCSSLTSFPLIDTSSGTNFASAWYNCSSLVAFPKIDTSSGTNFVNAWLNCFSLTSFPSNFFDSWRPASVSSGVFNNTWDGCPSLTAQSVENILTSIDASGKYATTNGASGGTALGDAGIDIDYNVSTGSLSAATNAAVTSLKSKGWSIIVNNVTL